MQLELNAAPARLASSSPGRKHFMSTPTSKPRVIVITGAAAGVGRATARLFAQTEGAHIGLLARGLEGLEGAKRDVEALGGKAIILQCDVADAEAVEAAAARVEQELGPIDVWVNDRHDERVFAFIKDMTTAAEFKRVTEVCYLGYVNGTLAALKRMLPRRSRPHHPGGERPCLSRHPAPGRLLRQQACHPGVHGFAARRADPR